MMKTETYKITGMSCGGCAARVKQAALSMPDVREADTAQDVIDAVERFGFGAQES